MRTSEIIKMINEIGGLNMHYIESAARHDGCSVENYIKGYVKETYDCSDYVARKVAEYYA